MNVAAQNLSSEYRVCVEELQNPKTALIFCGEAELNRLEEKINMIFSDYKKESETQGSESDSDEGIIFIDISKVVLAQEKWLVYRDSECAWEAVMPGVGVTMHTFNELSCKLELTKKRLKYLDELF